MTVQLKPLKDQTIVITGASSGIGLATARMAAKKGARLVLAARSEEALEEVVTRIHDDGGEAVHIAADVSDYNRVMEIAEFAEKHFAGFDTWVNNAGVSVYGKLLEVPIEDQRRIFDTNYWGVVNGSLVAAKHLKDNGGAIINIGSTLSDRAIPYQGAYSASKHAVKGFTDALRMELEMDRYPISVTLIKPGPINTPYTEHAKNYLEVEPQHPALAYSPNVVADAILYAAENPIRDLFAGGSAKMLSVLGHFAPRTLDKLMEAFIADTQKSNEPAPGNGDDSLYKPSNDPREQGRRRGHVANSSLYTKASMHPLATTAIATGIAGVAFLTARQLRNRPSMKESEHGAWDVTDV